MLDYEKYLGQAENDIKQFFWNIKNKRSSNSPKIPVDIVFGL